MTKYKFIFVVASNNSLSTNNPYYGNLERFNHFKQLNKMYYDKFKNDIKFFYVEYKENLENDISEIGNYIYIKGNECPLIPNFLTKMIKAFEHIHTNYNYEYIIHTNLSSFWNIPVLLSFYNEIPKNNFFGGYMGPGFVSGTGIFISHNLIPCLLNINLDVHDGEDVAISIYMISIYLLI